MQRPCASTALLFLTAALAFSQVSAQPDIVYGSADGVDLKLDLARPSEGAGPFPVVLCIHGGAWITGSKAVYGPVLQMLAGAGYAAASIDYRLAPRYKYPAQIDDVRLAAAYLRAHAAELNIDPSRMAVLGDSAGGHLALLLGLTEPRDRFRAVINLYGVSDVARWLPNPEGEQIEGMDAPTLLEKVYGTRDRSSDVLRKASPLTYVTKGNPPVLTMHGDADPTVRIEQAQWLHEALRKNGVEEKLVVVKGAKHGFEGQDMQTCIFTVVDFLGAHLKAAPAQ